VSAALDSETRESLAEGRATAGAMLRAAQKDLQKVFAFFLVGFLGTFYALRLYVWDVLKAVTESQMAPSLRDQVEFIAQTPFDVILLQAKLAMIAGVFLAIPAFVYFSRDALKERDLWPTLSVARWKLVALALLSGGLFVVGVAYSYSLLFPFLFEFFARNAAMSGFVPTYSIVKWAQFLLTLTVVFGFAAQLPLVMAVLSYLGIVPYTQFREKWRHAVLGIVILSSIVNGSPDPVSMSIVAVPLIALYGIGLGLSKVVTVIVRGQRLDFRGVFRTHWNYVVGVGVAAGSGTYLLLTRAGGRTLGRLFGYAGVSAPGPESALFVSEPLPIVLLCAAVGGFAALATLLVLVFASVTLSEEPSNEYGDPTAIDLDSLDAAGVRAAPEEAFSTMTEEEAMRRANRALEGEDHEKARAILDRFDGAEADGERVGAVEEPSRTDESEGVERPIVKDDLGDRLSRASGTLLREFTDEDDDVDEDDIGGYYRDITFILQTLTSKSFRIVGVFMAVMVLAFTWLSSGGIRAVKRDFLRRLPPQIQPESLTVITLHPAEALVFEMKFATLVGALATVPLVAYYAWPALRDRGFVRGRRRLVLGWTAVLSGGLLGGFAFGYFYVAPAVISYLVADAIRANMIISYRITDFFWLIFFTTAGIGLLADVPVLMLLLNHGGVSYRTMRTRWREVTVGILTFAAVFTPASVLLMLLVTIPVMSAYGVGLLVLFVVTLAGRRELYAYRSNA
jgi:sec-independent protein translocase protein TatC